MFQGTLPSPFPIPLFLPYKLLYNQQLNLIESHHTVLFAQNLSVASLNS